MSNQPPIIPIHINGDHVFMDEHIRDEEISNGKTYEIHDLKFHVKHILGNAEIRCTGPNCRYCITHSVLSQDGQTNATRYKVARYYTCTLFNQADRSEIRWNTPMIIGEAIMRLKLRLHETHISNNPRISIMFNIKPGHIGYGECLLIYENQAYRVIDLRDMLFKPIKFKDSLQKSREAITEGPRQLDLS